MDARLVEVESPLHGIVTRIERGVGHRVGRNSPVATIEAGMTMVTVQAGVDGTIEEVRAVLGAEVEPGYVLVVVAAAEAEPVSLRLIHALDDELVDQDFVDDDFVDDEVVADDVVADVDAELEGPVPDEVVPEAGADADADTDADADADQSSARTMVCTQCGSRELEPGFVEDRGSWGSGTWVQGRLEYGMFGPRLMGRQRRAVEAYRCVRCSHLELFAARSEW